FYRGALTGDDSSPWPMQGMLVANRRGSGRHLRPVRTSTIRNSRSNHHFSQINQIRIGGVKACGVSPDNRVLRGAGPPCSTPGNHSGELMMTARMPMVSLERARELGEAMGMPARRTQSEAFRVMANNPGVARVL